MKNFIEIFNKKTIILCLFEFCASSKSRKFYISEASKTSLVKLLELRFAAPFLNSLIGLKSPVINQRRIRVTF